MSTRHSRTSSARSDEHHNTTVENKSMAMYEDTLMTGASKSHATSTRARGYSSIMNQSYRDTTSGTGGAGGNSGGGISGGDSGREGNSGREPSGGYGSAASETDDGRSMSHMKEGGNSGRSGREAALNSTPPDSPEQDFSPQHSGVESDHHQSQNQNGGGGLHLPSGMKRTRSRDEGGSVKSDNASAASTSGEGVNNTGLSANQLYDVASCGLPPAPPAPVAPPGIMGALLGHQASGPHAYKLIASFVAGFVLLSMATLGIKIWHTAAWFHDPGPFASNSWAGYTPSHYVGLLLFTLCSTTGFSLFYVPLTIAGRYRSSQLALVLLLSFAALCFVVGVIAIATWGHPMMHCLGFFCVGPPGSWEHAGYSRPSSGFGFLVVIGTSACFSLCPIALVLCLQFYDRLFGKLSHGSSSWISGKYRNMHQLSRPQSKSRLFTAFLILMFLFFFFAATTWIPNSWEYFTAAQVAHNGHVLQSMDFDKCNNDYNHYTCSEYPWATFTAKNMKVKADLIMKIYPANVFFYVYLVSVLLFIVGARCVKPGRLFLKSEVKLIRSRIHLTYGELIVSTATALMLFLFSWYWFHDHNFNGTYGGTGTATADLGIAPSERYARAFGQLSVVLLSLLLFPASRNSVIHRLFGTSWEASLWAHKALGWGMIAATVAHVVAWYIKYHQVGIFPKAIFSVPTALPESIDNFTVPIITVAVIVMLITNVFLTYDGIRRGFFELFYYPHLFAAYLIIPTALWHAAAGWEYMLPGVTVWFVDRMIRMYRSGCEVLVTEVRLHEDTTEIRFQCPKMQVKAGQYVFINIPELSLFEWHPFTLSSGVGSAHFSVHVKAMYDGSWTARLLQLMEKTSERAAAGGGSGGKSSLAMETVITLAVDGPYGHAYDFEDYERVILVSGGIGVTPVASIYQTLQRETPNIEVLALWSTRKLSSLDAFRDQLEAPKFDPYKSTGKQKKCKMYLTKSTDDERAEAKAKAKTLRNIEICSGRPDLESNCRDESTLSDSCSTLLFVCGPLPLVEDAREVAHDLGYHFHAETFFL